MNYRKTSERIPLVAVAALLGGLLMAGKSGAVTFGYTVVFDPATATCGVYNGLGTCGSPTYLALPVTANIGDIFNVQVTTLAGAPIVVPGSAVNNGIYVGLFDALSTFENSGPGPVTALSTIVPIGLITTAGGAPFGGLQFHSRNYFYLSTVGYFGVPNNGFSATGLNASLEVVTPDVLPTIAISVGYYWRPSDTSGVVPEPATWALMIGGFGLAGVALRRRQRCVRDPMMAV